MFLKETRIIILITFTDPAVREAAPHRLLLLHWVGAHYTHARAQYQRQDARASGISCARKAVVVSPNHFCESVISNSNTQRKTETATICVITWSLTPRRGIILKNKKAFRT